jgi:hypothetical protein
MLLERSRVVSPPRLPTTLVAGVVVQCCQALVWMASGLVIGFDDGLRHHDPSAVVFVIAAIVVFSTGGFGLALAAGMISRSDECRIVSAVLQLVFAVVLVAGSLDVIDTPHGVLTMVLNPAIRLAAPLTVVMPASCLAAAILLLATRRRPIA